MAEIKFPLKYHHFFEYYRKPIRIVATVVSFVTFTETSLQRETLISWNSDASEYIFHFII